LIRGVFCKAVVFERASLMPDVVQRHAGSRAVNLPRNSAPFVTLTFCGFHSVKAFTGDADHDRQDEQWQ